MVQLVNRDVCLSHEENLWDKLLLVAFLAKSAIIVPFRLNSQSISLRRMFLKKKEHGNVCNIWWIVDCKTCSHRAAEHCQKNGYKNEIGDPE